MNANAIIGITAALVGCVVGLIIYMQQGKDAGYLARSKWDITIAEDGTAQTWYVDVATESIRVETVDDDGTLRVQEFIGRSMYDFALLPDYEPMDVDAFCSTELGTGDDDVDCEAFAAQLAEDTQALWEADAGTKHECSVQDLDGFAPSEAVVENGEIVVGGFHVLMTDGVPTAIVDHEGSTIATINSIEDWAGELDISGCTVDEDDSRKLELFEIIGESRRRRTTVDPAAEAAREHLNGIYMEFLTKNHTPQEAEEAGRHLLTAAEAADFAAVLMDAVMHYSAVAVSLTNWCGAGSDMANLPCPNAAEAPDYNGLGWLFNAHDDAACRRHDHGAIAVSRNFHGFAYVVLGCDIDEDLIAGSPGNWGTEGIFGQNGLAQLWGCYDKKKVCKWVRRRFGWWGTFTIRVCEMEDHILYGPSRFELASHKYGYKVLPRTCDTDRAWWTTDGQGYGQCASNCA